MHPFIQRGTSLTLSLLLLISAGFGDALHWLPGMGHDGHCHGLACGSSQEHLHGHTHHVSKPTCCGTPSKTKSRFESPNGESQGDESEASESEKSQAGEQHECGLCKFLASLKHATPIKVVSHQWVFLPATHYPYVSHQGDSQVVLSYHGRAPPGNIS